MIYEIQGDLQIPYLRAIQTIPGNTANEKLMWIGRLISRYDRGESEHFPQELLPLLQVEMAVKKKNHEDITAALKSEDSTIVSRAFRATWFFDGSHKDIVNAEYFLKHIFPFASTNTRVRIVTTLANRLTDMELAQQLFTKMASFYGICDAYPLIVACDEAFVYNTIVERKLVLPSGIVKKIFRKNPDLVVRYLKLLKPANKIERASFPVNIDKYKFILPKLVKNRLEAFAELFEMHEKCPPTFTLSNTCTEIFLKKGQHYLCNKPLLYINILPLKKINADLMESIFIGLLPQKSSCFDIDKVFKYLKYYPQNKKYELLRESYKAKYGIELLDESINITPTLLQILPAEERIKQARIKLEKDKLKEVQYDIYNIINYERTWICYLPVNEVIPIIKEKLNKTPNELDRNKLIEQMFYACKVNEDDDALAESLEYFKNRCKNENPWFLEQTMNHLSQLYEISNLNKKQNSLLFEIVQLFYVKHGYVKEQIIEDMIHFRLNHNMPIVELVRMLFDTNNNRWYMNFNVLKKYPQYERKILTIFAEIIQEKYISQNSNIETDYTKRLICHFVGAMYNFNNRCNKSHANIQRLTINSYPWLLNIISKIIQSNEINISELRKILRINEPEWYYSQCSDSSKIVDLKSGEALALLKRNPQDILNNWEEYLIHCKKQHFCIQVQRFVRATRWYNEIPIKFVERSMDYLHEKHKDSDGMLSTLTILTLLLHGDTLAKLIEPLIPTETTIDVNNPEASENYKVVRHLTSIMKLSNPPVPLEFIAKLCEGDYLSVALMSLTNVSRRSGLKKVLLFANKLCKMRVSVRKHGIRLMYQVAPNQLANFLQKIWNTEDNYSIRQVIFNVVQNILSTDPILDNWFLYCSIVQSINIKDEMLLSKIKLLPTFPNEYVLKFFIMWHEVITNLKQSGLSEEKTNKYIINLLQEITAPVCNLLSESFAQDIMKRYLFAVDADLSRTARKFSMLYLFSEDETKLVAHTKEFIDIFRSILLIDWNTTHPKKSRFFPYNNAVHLFVEDFVVGYVNRFSLNRSTNTQFIDDMLKLFSSVLVPTQDARSYLLLTYTKKLQECMITNKGFGEQLDQLMPELVKIFSSSLVQFMAKILNHFIERVLSEHINLEEFKLNVVEGLIKTNNPDSCLMAVTILSPLIIKNLETRYDRLIVKFKKMQNPAVTSILHDHQNMLTYNNIIFD